MKEQPLPGYQGKEYAIEAFVRCNASSAGTSSAKLSAVITLIRNSEGPFRSPSRNTYAITTLLTTKATSWSVVDMSSTQLHQLTARWHALYTVRPLYYQLRVAQGIPSAKVHDIRRNEWPVWPYYALQVPHNPWHSERCTDVQSLSSQPTRPSSLMVPLSLVEFRKHVLRYLRSLCGPMFCLLKAEHKHLAKHQAVEEQVTQRLHEAVRVSSTPRGILQYGCHPANLQVKYQLGHAILWVAH